MSDRSKIEWTEATWNPVTGCTEVSEGCDHCYARTFAERFRGVPGHPYEQGFDLRLWPSRLDQPLRWTRPRVVFVNSMSDLFQDGVPREFVVHVFAIMALASRHTFQILTKRPGRMASLLSDPGFAQQVRVTASRMVADRGLNKRDNSALGNVMEKELETTRDVLRNVWLGTSVETQKWAEVRIPRLLAAPAAVRFLSCEPLLGPIDFGFLGELVFRVDVNGAPHPRGIDWVIVGGESGAGARPMRPDWAREIRDQCLTAGIPYFFKQWGGRTPKAGGRVLDGRTWDEMPTLQVEAERQFLASAAR